MVQCPICGKPVHSSSINEHLDSGCVSHLEDADTAAAAPATAPATPAPAQSQARTPASQKNGGAFASIFQRPPASRSFDGSSAAKEEDQNHAHVAHATPTGPTAHIGEPDEQTRPPKRARDEDAHVTSPPLKRSKPDAVVAAQPLAERMRPKTLDDVCGQELVAPNGVLRSLIETNRLPSMIFWGGPGTGKTTIARLIASTSNARFVEINSTSSGVSECKRLFAEARNELALTGRKTIIFCDEIHRFSKSQQDVFLAPVEAGTVTLIGATTENPSFKVINALMSRCRVFTLASLEAADVEQILRRTLAKLYPPEDATSPPSLIDDTLLSYLATAAAGDARTGLNLLDLSLSLVATQPDIDLPQLKTALTTSLLHDRAGEGHYNLISALHKSIRGSAPSAALYYLARMLTAGEDPLYIARRLLIIASEDVGLADNSLLPLASATWTAVHALGMPEARIPLAHCASALALAPKSVRAYRAYAAASAAASAPGAGAAPVPLHLRNAPTRLLRDLGAGEGYKYNPDYAGGRVRQQYMPPGMEGVEFLGDLDLGTQVDPDLLGEVGDADGCGDGDGAGGERDVAGSAGAAEGEAQAHGGAGEGEPGEGPRDEKIELEEWEA